MRWQVIIPLAIIIRGLQPGNYTLVVTPYSGHRASGTAGNPFTIHFTVVGQPCGTQKALMEESYESDFDIDAYPNPFNNNLIVEFNSDETGTGWLMLKDLLGRKVMLQEIAIQSGVNHYELQINDRLAKAAYLLEVVKDNGAAKSVKLVMKE